MMMKRLLIIFTMVVFPLIAYSQTAQSYVTAGDTTEVLTDSSYTFIELVGDLDSTKLIRLKPLFTKKINIADTTTNTIGNYMSLNRTSNLIADTVLDLKANAVQGLALQDSGEYVGGYVTPTMLDEVDLGWYNVVNYGAVGDSITDDTEAIKAAITAAGSKGKVIFPKGIYIISDTLLVDNYMNIEGDGSGNTSKIIQTINAPVFLVDAPFTNPARSPKGKISDLILIGCYTSDSTNNHGIVLKGHSWTVDNCNINHMGGYGVFFDNENDHSFTHSILNCVMFENYKAGIYGVGKDGEYQINAITIRDCDIQNNFGYGVYMWGNTININNNEIQGNDSTGVYLSCVNDGVDEGNYAKAINITGNYFESNGGSSIYADVGYDGTYNYIVYGLKIEGNYLQENSSVVVKPEATGLINLALQPGSETWVRYFYSLYVGINTYLNLGTMTKVAGNSILDHHNTIWIDRKSSWPDDYTGVVRARLVGAIESEYSVSGDLTDGAPTDAELDAVIGFTPSEAGLGYRVFIRDTTGSDLIYLVTTNGSNWQYQVLTIAL